jgi:hypothetical protein
MSGQPQLLPTPEPAETHEAAIGGEDTKKPAPVWLQRVSLCVLVLFCIYLGILVMVLPWSTRLWDHNGLILSYPWLASILHHGAVRGIISGVGLIDIWIGISEAVHYRDFRG